MKTELRIESVLPHDPESKFIILGGVNEKNDEVYDLDVYGNERGEPATVITSLTKEEAAKIRDALTAFVDG